MSGAESPEAVALHLYDLVATAEKTGSSVTDQVKADRDYILDTYAECLRVVRGDPRQPGSQ